MKNIISISFLFFSFISSCQNFELLDSLIVDHNLTFIKDLNYGEKEKNKLDLLLPNSKIKTPLIIYLHGGGYRGGKKENSYKKETYNSYQIL